MGTIRSKSELLGINMELIQTLKSNFFITQLQFIKLDIYFVFYDETYNSGVAAHMLCSDKCLCIFTFVKSMCSDLGICHCFALRTELRGQKQRRKLNYWTSLEVTLRSGWIMATCLVST